METPDQTLQAIFDQAAVGIAQIGLDGAWLRVNNRYCQMLGYSEAELRTMTPHDVTHPDDYAEVLASRRQLLDGAISSHSMEKRYIRRDGTVFWGRLHRSLVRDHDNLPKYFIAVVEDITEKIQAERALRDSEQRLALAQNAARLGVWDCDLRTNITVISGEYARLHGLGPDHPSLTHEEWIESVHPADRERVEVLLRESIDQTHSWDTEFRVLRPDGSVRWLLAKGQVFLGDSGLPVRMAGVSLDITERKQAEAQLRESEERFRNMADAAPVMICTSGPDKLATFFNKGWLSFTGRTMEQEFGYGWTESVHPDDVEECLATYSASFDGRQNCHIEYRLRRADGEYRSVVCSGVPRFAPDGVFAGYIASCIDITDTKRAQEEALARQKLESLGVLASGIAHDFNNLLGGILASSELALLGRADSSPIEEELQRIRTAAIRGAEVVRELMIFGGQESAALERVDASLLVREMLELLKVSISKHTTLHTELGEELPAVQANPAQLRQVVMNLVINASEAIGEREGVIRIRTSVVRVGKDLLVTDGKNLPEGDYLHMEVSDTGTGMTPEVQARIFDPFFTTKFAGRGLGLAVTRGIVRSHGGAIQVNTSGRGTSFQVWLPCVAKTAREPPHSIALAGAERVVSRTGTILVVEDEDLLRLSVTKALEKRGFSVMDVSDGSAALDLIRARANDIDVVLLDVTLPGASSGEILEEAGRIRPELKVILTSAYGKETVNASLTGQRVPRFIRKPFRLAELVGELQDALSA